MTHIVSAADSIDFPKRPDVIHIQDGYLYVVEFSNGTLKVGRSVNPAQRLGAHHGAGERFSNEMTRWWVSKAHRNFKPNETILKRFCGTKGSLTGGAEYFSGVEMEEVVAFANSLEIDASTDQEIREDEERAAESLAKFRAFLYSGTEKPEGKEDWTSVLLPPALAMQLSIIFAPTSEVEKMFGNFNTPDGELDQVCAVLRIAETLEMEPEEVLGWEVRDLFTHFASTIGQLVKLETKIRLLEMGSLAFDSAWGIQNVDSNA